MAYQVTVLGEEGWGREFSRFRVASPPNPRGLGTRCPLGAQAKLGCRAGSSAPHDSSRNVPRHLLSRGIPGHMQHGAVSKEHVRQEAGVRAGPGTTGPSLLLHWAAEVTSGHLVTGEASTSHLNLPQTSGCIQRWDLRDAWSEPRVPSPCSLTKRESTVLF